MSVQKFKALLFRSALLQKEIERETKHRLPDWIRLLKLKKLRLAVKDRMTKLLRRQPTIVLEAVRERSRTY